MLIRILTITALCTIMLMTSPNSYAQDHSVILDTVEGLAYWSDTTLGPPRGIYLNVDQPITFRFNLSHLSGSKLLGVCSPFIISSPDGAEWLPLTIQWYPDFDWTAKFDGLVMTKKWSDGISPDTVLFDAFSMSEIGLTPGFSYPAYLISTEFSSAFSGKTICIDTIDFNNFRWIWATVAINLFVPDWDGPHCFIIDCCQGMRGNVAYDLGNANVIDLTFLVDYIFRGSGDPGSCKIESDVNGDGTSSNILDLTYLVDYIFRNGPSPGPCP